MRIIAGLAKGRRLLSPEGNGTRPTLDRVKESMFSIIQLKVPNSRVLDVFAGTGSLGLEAVSRGASECYLVDKGAKTYSYLKENVANLNFSDRCICFNMDSYEVLKLLSKKDKVFDIIFIDPPYMKDMIPKAIEMIDEESLLDKEGIIVTKIDTSEDIYEGSKNIKLKDCRKYGNTTVCFYYFKED